jgi:hypothetical protein
MARLVAVSDKGTLQDAEMTISVKIECGHARLAAFPPPA